MKAFEELVDKALEVYGDAQRETGKGAIEVADRLISLGDRYANLAGHLEARAMRSELAADGVPCCGTECGGDPETHEILRDPEAMAAIKDANATLAEALGADGAAVVVNRMADRQ